jgi:Zn-dependent membrane protease YugP
MEILLYIIPFILVLGAQGIVSGTYNKYKVVENKKGLTGAEVARQILDENDLSNITVVKTNGTMSDHYDPKAKTVRLSKEVYEDATISSIAIAAHECGHAIQHQNSYAPLALRSAFVPVANIGSMAAWPIIILGVILSWNSFLLNLGIILFSAAVLFQLITLPVEFNASKRAIARLSETGIPYGDELGQSKKVLDAAALTYVAAAAAMILQLLRLILLFGGGRRRD